MRICTSELHSTKEPLPGSALHTLAIVVDHYIPNAREANNAQCVSNTTQSAHMVTVNANGTKGRDGL